MTLFKILMSVSILVVFSTGMVAAVWTVDSNPGNHAANFSSIQAAHDVAEDGDTIYVSGFNIPYGNVTVSKRLYIFGTGYFLDENDSTQANTYPARIVDWVAYNAGSENSEISGCVMNAIYVRADGITIKRNVIYHYGYWGIYIENSADYITIVQNYINPTLNGIDIGGGDNNINISNNFISSGSGYTCVNSVVSNTNIILENNVLFGGLTLYNTVISNNIYRGGTYTGNSSNIIQNNICNGTQFDTTGHNQQNINMSTVFVTSGTTDSQWQIDPAGPAAGAGTNGTDIGMYSGNTPYVLSGIPVIPTIYHFYGPSNASQSFQVQAKIKSRR